MLLKSATVNRSEAFILYGSFAFVIFIAFGSLVTYLMCK